jgi:hypothetical protein
MTKPLLDFQILSLLIFSFLGAIYVNIEDIKDAIFLIGKTISTKEIIPSKIFIYSNIFFPL